MTGTRRERLHKFTTITSATGSETCWRQVSVRRQRHEKEGKEEREREGEREMKGRQVNEIKI